MKDHAADQDDLNPDYPVTPEQVVLSLTLGELQELLSEVRMNSDVITAQRLKRLVRKFRNFELAMEAIGGPAILAEQPRHFRSAEVRRAA